MIILNTNTNIEFIPSTEKDAEKPLTFILSPPTYETVLNIQQSFSISEKDGKPEINIDNVKIARILLTNCVRGWKNVFSVNEKGELIDLPFTQEHLELVTDIEIITELIAKINELGELKKKIEKD